MPRNMFSALMDEEKLASDTVPSRLSSPLNPPSWLKGGLSAPSRFPEREYIAPQVASGAAKELAIGGGMLGWPMDLAAILNQLKHADLRGRKTYHPTKIHAVTGMPSYQVKKDYPIDFNTEKWDDFAEIPGTTDFWAKKLGIPFEHTTPETVGRIIGGILGGGAPLVPGTKAFGAALKRAANMPPGPSKWKGQLGHAGVLDMPSFKSVSDGDPAFYLGGKTTEGNFIRGGKTPYLINPSAKEIEAVGKTVSRFRTTKDVHGNFYAWDASDGTHQQFHEGIQDKLGKDIEFDLQYWKDNTEQVMPWDMLQAKAAKHNPPEPSAQTKEVRAEQTGAESRTVIPDELVGAPTRTIDEFIGDLYEGSSPTPASAESISAPVAPEADLLRDPGGVARGVDESRQAPAQVPQDQPLAGLPTYATIAGEKVRITPNASVRQMAAEYVGGTGRDYVPITTYKQVDQGRAKRIASAYDEMAHAPTNPEVQQAYNAMINETAEQYRALLKSGIKIEFIPLGAPDPYAASPRMAIQDVNNNNHLWVFPTRDGYGQGGITAADLADNPLLAQTEFIISGERALANDIFRAVHDIFGHIKEGNGFRWTGEENAWRSHASMYTPLARKAMTSETRGQNSWINFGPSGDANRLASSADTVYAEQKIGLLPEWIFDEGLADAPAELAKPMRRRRQSVDDAQRTAFPGIYKDPRQVVDEAAEKQALEDPALKEVFGVTRDDLYEMSKGRVGGKSKLLKRPAGARDNAAAVENIKTRRNENRLLDVLMEGQTRHPDFVKGQDAWYTMDPAFQRLEELVGRDEAVRLYNQLNTTTGMMSPASDVMAELNRGTATHYAMENNLIDDWLKHGGKPPAQRPPSLDAFRHAGGHLAHTTAHGRPLRKYVDSGEIQMDSSKVPVYIESSGVPNVEGIPFQTGTFTGDAHMARNIGLSDTRTAKDYAKSLSPSELRTAEQWFADKVASPAGLQPVSAQARLWTLLGPQTGVQSALGAPKLELLARRIMNVAKREGVSVEVARDKVLRGKWYASLVAGTGLAAGVSDEEGSRQEMLEALH
jgi:hypothetical protein